MKKFEAKIKDNKENPFYGSRNLLNAFQQMPKISDESINEISIKRFLDNAYVEAKGDTQKTELFYSILFMLGDISNREHNLFKKKKIAKPDQGGNSLRRVFFYCCNWMLTYNQETKKQFYEFLPIIGEYTNIENIFLHQLVTDRKSGIVKKEFFLPIEISKVTDYIASVISNPKTPDVIHTLWAKFLPRPSFGKRKRVKTVLVGREKSVLKITGENLSVGDTFIVHKSLKEKTIEKEKWEVEFITSLSKKLNWEIIQYPKNLKFVGLEDYKKKYLKMTEAHLFSSKEILNWDKDQLFDWFSTLPSGARFRVQKRLFNLNERKEQITTGKWIGKAGDIADVYTSWQKAKLAAQETLMSLTEEDKSNLTKKELKQLEKNAKVNTGGETLVKLLAKWKGSTLSENEINIVTQSILDKIKVEVPILIFADVSGSMGSSSSLVEGVTFTAREMAALATTAFLLKNPDPELRGMFGIFSSNTNIVSDYSYMRKVQSSTQTNRFLSGGGSKLCTDRKIVDPSKHFLENFQNVKSIMESYDFASTNLVSISDTLKRWVDSDSTVREERIEQILKYPIILTISDGDFNGYGGSADTLRKFQMNMRQWFGWEGITVVWDVKAPTYYGTSEVNKFEGCENAMYFGGTNVGTLNQIFTNINDLDIIDVYLPLQALYRSNRYDAVKELIIKDIPKPQKQAKDKLVS